MAPLTQVKKDGLTWPMDGAVMDNLECSDSIIHSGDTNTKLRFPAADTFTVETAGSERIRVASDGRILIGITSGATSGSTNEALLTVSGNSAGASNPPHINLWRNSSINSGNELGSINFCGESGNGVPGAVISAQSDAEWNTSGDASDHPGRLLFSTTPDGSSVPTERMRITSAGDVGIGTDTPGTLTWRTGHTLDVFAGSGNASGQLYLGASRGDGVQSVGSIIFYDNSQTASHQNVAIIEVDKAGSGTNTRGSDFLFYNKADNSTSTPVTFKIRSGGSCEIPDGNLKFASGHGIDFSATSDATGATNEVLADYEEGSWTPVVTGGVAGTPAYTFQRAWYVKAGNLVHASMFLRFVNSATGSTGNSAHFVMGGLPFASANVLGYSAGGVVTYTNLTWNSNVQKRGWIGQNSQNIEYYYDNNSSANLGTGDNTSKDIYAYFVYRAA